MTVRLFRLTGALMLISAAAGARAEPPTRVPFVGCPADGQVGPIAAPRDGPVPAVPPEAISDLAYYRSEHLGVLAPRDWHCLETYGSNGANLFVSPDPITFEMMIPYGHDGLRGPAIQLGISHGGTSGRFAVARIVARVFPAHLDFARAVVMEEAEGGEPLETGPWHDDSINYLDRNALEYLTPDGAEGLGTASLLVAGGGPIVGLVVLEPEEMDLLHLSVRLPPDLQRLSRFIVAEVRQATDR